MAEWVPSDKGHYFRVPKGELEATILSFVQQLTVTPESAQIICERVIAEWDRRQAVIEEDTALIDGQIK